MKQRARHAKPASGAVCAAFARHDLTLLLKLSRYEAVHPTDSAKAWIVRGDSR